MAIAAPVDSIKELNLYNSGPRRFGKSLLVDTL